jgi:hypothetical protein
MLVLLSNKITVMYLLLQDLTLAVTECNDIFLGNHICQYRMNFQCFKDCLSLSILNPWRQKERQLPKIEIHSVLDVELHIHFSISNFQFSDNWFCFMHQVWCQKGSVSHLPEWEVSSSPPPFKNYKTRVFMNSVYI